MRNQTIDGCLDALDLAQADISRLRRENESLTQSYKEHVAEIDRLHQQLVEIESLLWRIPPNTHSIPCELNDFATPDHFEGEGETYKAAYERVSTQLAERGGPVLFVESAFREGHRLGRCGGSGLDEDDDWGASAARATLLAAPSWIAAADVNRMARELDVAMNGEDGAAKAPSLCDVVAQAKKLFGQRGEPVHDAVDALDDIANDLESISGKPQHTDPRVSTVRRALVSPPAQSAVPELLDQASARAECWHIGDELHNFACSRQDDDALSLQLGGFVSRLWSLAQRLSAAPSAGEAQGEDELPDSDESEFPDLDYDAKPCPFCGSLPDPEGWLDGNGNSGPECDGCGATARSMEEWNRREQGNGREADTVTIPRFMYDRFQQSHQRLQEIEPSTWQAEAVAAQRGRE